MILFCDDAVVRPDMSFFRRISPRMSLMLRRRSVFLTRDRTVMIIMATLVMTFRSRARLNGMFVSSTGRRTRINDGLRKTWDLARHAVKTPSRDEAGMRRPLPLGGY